MILSCALDVLILVAFSRFDSVVAYLLLDFVAVSDVRVAVLTVLTGWGFGRSRRGFDCSHRV